MHSNFFVLAWRETKSAFKGKARKLVVGAVALIPLLYGAMYLWAFTNPYKTLDTVPVAIVIEDKGARINGEMRNVGSEIKHRLQKLKSGKDGFQWNFVNRKRAMTGLKNGDYFMVATVPSTFSKNIASAAYDTPERAKLHVSYDQASNMLASQIGNTAFHAIRSEISEAIAEEYWEHMFSQINKSADSLGEAVDGSSDLHEGVKSLQSGISRLAGGSRSLSGSMETLRGGLGELQQGAQALSTANTRTAAGAKLLQQNLQKLNGAMEKLDAGSTVLAAQTGKFSQGVQKLAASSQSLVTGVKAADAKNKQQLVALLKQLQGMKTDPTLLMEIQQLVSAMAKDSATLETNLGALSQGAGNLLAASAKIGNGIRVASQGVSAAHNGSQRLSQGASELASSLDQVSRGSQQLSLGINKASVGVGALQNGSKQLGSGVDKILANTPRLVNGTQQLHDRLQNAQDSSRVKSLARRSKMMSAPVALEETNYTKVENYGTGFAPYFISIGLWVGALITTFIMRTMNRRALLNGRNPIKSTLISITPLAVMGIVQALILLLVIHLVLRLQINNVPAFYILGIIAGITFMTLMQLIISAFGIPGRLVAIILLMLQITSSAGTFPIEMTPPFFQIVHPFLPMTYSIMGIRQAMSGKDTNTILFACGILILFGVASLAVSSIIARRKQIVRMNDLHPIIKLVS